MKTDEELLKTFKVEQQALDLVYIEISESEKEEDNNARQADMIVDSILKTVGKTPNTSFKFLVDLTKIGTATYMSNHAREVYTQLPSHHLLNKAAVVGNNLFLEVSVNLLMQAAGRGQSFKWFKDVESAKKWLAS